MTRSARRGTPGGRSLRAAAAGALVLALLLPARAPAAEAKRPERVKTVIVGLAARRGVDAGLALAMSDIVQGAYTADVTRTVFGREDIKRVIDFESERQALGCDDTACLSEIAQAMSVDRIVTGSMDKVGTSYLVVITEIDAKSVEPIARVQGTLPAEEDQLIGAVSALARSLVEKARSARIAAALPSQAAVSSVVYGGGSGALVFQMVPAGTAIKIADRDVGRGPARVDQLPPGTHQIELHPPGAEAVVVSVPVYEGQATDVSLRPSVEAPLSPEEVASFSDRRFFHNLAMGSKLGVGGLCLLCGGSCLSVSIGTVASDPTPGSFVMLGTGLAGTLGGLGLAGWGLLDLANPPRPPANPVVHAVTITPPPGRGAAQTIEIPAAMAH